MLVDSVCALRLEYRCRRAARCSDRTLDRAADATSTWVGAQIRAVDGLCSICDSRARTAVNHLPADYVELSLLLAPTGSAVSPVSGTPDLKVPIRLGVEAVMTELDAEVSWWAESVLDAMGSADVAWADEVIQRKRPGPRIEYGARILAYYWEDLLGLPTQTHVIHDDGHQEYLERDGLDAASVFLDVHERVRVIAGRSEHMMRLPAPCPSCDAMALVRANGQENITCRRCGQILRPQEYASLVTVLAADWRDSA